jgi:hypothetical protein
VPDPEIEKRDVGTKLINTWSFGLEILGLWPRASKEVMSLGGTLELKAASLILALRTMRKSRVYE